MNKNPNIPNSDESLSANEQDWKEKRQAEIELRRKRYEAYNKKVMADPSSVTNEERRQAKEDNDFLAASNNEAKDPSAFRNSPIESLDEKALKKDKELVNSWINKSNLSGSIDPKNFENPKEYYRSLILAAHEKQSPEEQKAFDDAVRRLHAANHQTGSSLISASAVEARRSSKAEKKPRNYLKTALTLGIAALSLVGILKETGNNSVLPNKSEPITDKADVEGAESIDAGEQAIEQVEYTKHEQLNQLIDGSFEQYDNVGLYKYEMDKKIDPTAVGNTTAVLEYLGINPETATADDYAEVIKYFAFSQKETAAFIAVANGLEGFEDFSYEQAEKKVLEMDEEERKAFVNQLLDYFNNSSFNLTTSNGSKENHFVKEDENGRTYGVFREVDTTGMKELEVTFQKKDGSAITIAFELPCGNGEITIIKTLPSGETEITTIKIDNPDPNPDPDPDPDKPGTPEKEWGKEGDAHAGENVTVSEEVVPEAVAQESLVIESNPDNYYDYTPGITTYDYDDSYVPESTDSGAGNTWNGPAVIEYEPIQIVENEQGNENQGAAQETNEVGGDNYSDAAEEDAVWNNDF